MINENLVKAFNEQINAELEAEYLYFAMKTYFAELNLQGFVNWFDIQVQEEHAHALGLYNYLLERGGCIELEAIDKPVFEANSPLGIFEQVLAHEEFITSKINKLMDIADEAKDRAALSFLNWYVEEQVEEEASVGGVLATLRFIGDDKHALLLLDKDLATRVYNPPVIG